MSAERSAIERQTRDAVNALLSKEADAPAETLAKTICQLISVAARNVHEPRQGVVDASRGGMAAVIVAHRHPVETAALMLVGLGELSLMTRVGPTDLMSWTMEGIAEALAENGPDHRSGITEKIEERFHGAGEVFSGLCDQAAKAFKPPQA